MLLDDERLLGQRREIRVVEGKSVAVRRCDVDRAHALVGAGFRVHHLERFAPQVLAQNGTPAGAQSRLVKIKFVGLTAPCTTVSPSP